MGPRIRGICAATVPALCLSATLVVGPDSTLAGNTCHSGQCVILFDKAIYHRGNWVQFESDPGFKARQHVRGTLTCGTSYVRHFRQFGAASDTRVHGRFRLRHHMPFGECTLTIKARHPRNEAAGNFNVRARHRH